MNKQQIRDKIIQNGVKNLIEFGYNDVKPEELFNVDIYRAFFLGMLKDDCNVSGNQTIDSVIEELIQELEAKANDI